MDGYSTGNVNIPSSISPLDFASLYAPQQQMMPQQGMPLPISYGMGQPQNVPMAPVDQNFQVPYQQPQQPQQPPPELQHVTDVLTQYIQSKQDQQNSNGLTEQILAQRFQPQMQDIGRSITQTAQSYGAPDLFKPLDPYQAASQRATSELAPYTASLDMGMKQAQLQNQQVANQFQPQNLQADLALKQAQTQAATGFGMFGNNGGTPSGAATGDQFLKTLNPAMANLVQGVAQGRIPYPTGMALRTPMGQQLAAAVNMYDPSFDSINAGNRAKTLQGFSVGGKEATALNALNTVAGHLGILSNAADVLNNTSGFPGATYVNQGLNAAESSAGDPRLNNFLTARDAVSNELAKAYRGGVVSDSERKAWDDALSSASSPEQFKAVFGTLSDLLQSKINALQQQYTQGMGPYSRPMQFITPDAQATFSRLSAGAAPNNTPSGGVSEGATATNPQTGQKIVFKNGQWSSL